MKTLHSLMNKAMAFVGRTILLGLLLLGVSTSLNAQTTTLNTVGANYNGSNGAGVNFAVTFVLQNTNSYPMLLTGASTWVNNTDGVGTYQLWYSSTSLSGLPTPITSPTWTMIQQATGVAAPAVSGITPVLSGMSFVIPANTQYRFAMYYVTTSSHYSGTGVGTVTPNTFSAAGITMKVGDVDIPTGSGSYVGYGGPNNPRFFTGGVTFQPFGPCIDPPVAGTAVSSPSSICVGQTTTLNMTGGTGGSGQTYQWKSSSVSGGPYTNVGPTSFTSALTVNPTVPTYYVCETTCGLGTATSTETSVFVPTPFPGGNYTINNALPTGGTNFNSFTAAVSAISCGISGPVVFDVDPASGPYTEQITLPATIGSTAINTVTFNGNGRTLQFNSTNANARHIIKIDGADYITFNELTIDGSAAAATYAWAVHLTNGADYNTFSLCNLKTSTTNITSSNHYPVVFSASATSATTAGNNGNYNTFIDCTLSGGYYGVSMYGSGVGSENIGNTFINDIVKEYYLYGVFTLYNKGALFSGCDFSRPTRTTTSTTAGIYQSTGAYGNTIENCRVHNLFDAATTSTSTLYGFYLAGAGTVAEPNKIINCVIYDIRHKGAIYGIYNSSASNSKIYHNTMSFDFATAAATGVTYGIYQTGAATGIDIRNNLITLSRQSSAVKTCLYYATTASTITSNNNVIFPVTNGTGVTTYGYWGATAYATKAAFTTASGGLEANSVQADPVYTAAASPTYNFTPTSILTNNIGANVGVPNDILGNPRLAVSPDPGAYEYALSGLDAGISWVSPTSPTTPGLKTITVNLVNNLSTPITSLTLAYNTPGGTPVTQSFTGLSFLPSTSQNISFSTQYNLTASATIRAYIVSVNGVSDNAQGNDTTAYQSLCLQLSGSYTINAALATGGSNFQSFTALASALSCGGVSGPVVVDVVPGSGPYNEQVAFGVIPGSSVVNTITINGNNNILTSAGAAEYHTLRLNGADYMNWNNLVVNATNASTAIALVMSNGSDNNTFVNCTFAVNQANTSSTSSAVAFSASTTSATTAGNNGNNNIFSGCTMSGGYYCVSLYGQSTTVTNTNNQFYNCTITEFYYYGMYVLYQTAPIVKNCIVERPTRATVSGGYSIYLSSTVVGGLFEGNRIRKIYGGAPGSTATGAGFYCFVAGTLGNENRFINNVIADITHAGGFYGMYMSGANFTQVYHNTIAIDGLASTGTGTIYGIYNSGTTGADYRNNIITVRRGGTGSKYCLYYGSMPAISNYNDLVMNSAGATNYVAYTTSTAASYATLAAYQSSIPTLDQQSIAVNPYFNNPALNDYKPTEVLMNDLGINLGIATDITGAVRPTPPATNPDMGAYEFSVAPTDLGMFSFDGPGTNGCYSANQDVTVTVKNYGTSIIDFTVNPATISCDISGAVTTTLSTTINTGTLAAGATLPVTLSSFNMTGIGSYTFSNISLVMPGDGLVSNNVLPTNYVRTVGIIAGSISTPSSTVCISSPSPTITLSGNYGGSIQWKQSTVSATGPWTNVGTGAQTFVPGALTSPTYYFQAELTCNSNTDTTNVLTVSVTNPQLTSTIPGSRCGTGTVDLGATAPAGTSIKWYANQTGGTALGTGNTFTTPVINATTDFYAEAVSGAGLLTGLGCTATPTTSGYNAQRGIQFDAYQTFTLVSFDFYAAYAGTTALTVVLQNSAGTTLQTFSLTDVSATATAGWHTVPLNMIVQPGTGYKLLCTFVSGSLSNYSHSTGANYATTAFNNLGSVGLITNGLDNGPVVSTTSYWYFYNLVVSAGCNSLRTPVTASVNTSPTISLTTTSSTICDGSSATLSVSSPNDPNYTYTWLPGGATGSSITVNPSSATVYTVNALDNTTGTYAGCGNQATQSIAVNPTPTPITVTPNSATLCAGTVQSLASTGGTIGGLYTLGTGSTTTSTMGNTPYGSYYESEHVQYLIQASELTAMGMVAGNITSLAFNVTTSGAFWQKGFTIKLGATTTSAFSSAYLTPTGAFTTVVGPDSIAPPAVGWKTHTFITPYYWNGTSNILVDICHSNDNAANTCGTCYGTSSTVAASTTSFSSYYGTYNDNTDLCAGTGTLTSTGTTRPDIRFNSSTPTNLSWTPASSLYTDNAATIAYAGTSVSTVYAKPMATTTYTVTATTSNGCTRTNSASINVNQTSSSTTTYNLCGSSYTWNGNTYTAAGTYTYVTTNAVGCDSTATLVLTTNPCNTTLNLTCFIQGYWDGISGMAPALYNQGETSTITACDSIDVELHSDTAPYGIDASVRVVLNQDGTATCVFPPVTGNKYIVVKHRNALQTWSADPIAMSTTVAYNFSDADTKAYGNNMIQVSTTPSVWAFYSGDVVVDENMDLLDLGSVESDISNFGYGYLPTDLNGDGNVDLLDSPMLESNISNFIYSNHP